MTLIAFRKILLLLGMVSVLLGPGIAVSAVDLEQSPVIFMDGPLAHAMNHQNHSDFKGDCAGMDADMDCNDCEMTACNMSGCSLSFVTDASKPVSIKVATANAPGAPQSLTGLNRQNLPLPPP